MPKSFHYKLFSLFLLLGIMMNACKGQADNNPPQKVNKSSRPIPEVIGTPPPANPVHNPYNDRNLVAQYIRAIFQDSKGNYWFGPAEQSVAKYDGKVLEYYSKDEFFQGNNHIDSERGHSVHAIAEDKLGNVWFGTEFGLVKYDGKVFTSFDEKQGLTNIRMGRNSVFSDKSGKLWVGTHEGVFTHNPASDCSSATCFSLFDLLPPIHSADIMEDKEGNIWFASREQGVFRYDGKTIENLSEIEGLGNNVAGGMAQDKRGNMWFTMKDGICRYDGKSFETYTTKDGIGGSEVWGIYMEDSGIIWITSRGSTTKFDPSIPTSNPDAFKVYKVGDGLNCCVQSMYQDSSGNMWWGTGQGLYQFDGKSFYQVRQDGPWR